MASGLEPYYGNHCQRQFHVPVTVFGKTISFDRRAANQLLRAVMKAYEIPYQVYRIESFNCRQTTSGKSWSTHAWAAAVDINPEKNPFTTGALKTDMPSDFVECFTSEGFGWGGGWRSVKDAMHFSLAPNEGGRPKPHGFDRALQQAAIELWMDRHGGVNPEINVGPTPKKPGKKAPTFPGYDMDRERYSRKEDDNVRLFQERLAERGWNLDPTGKFNQATEQIVRAFQREKRLFVDGVVGKNTWRLIWEADIT
ncbi:MAG: M15 family metallopeptidase [Actinobacteria bacterium]|nr:M15 family metallopeptidase [Actinomycetota bacterium]